MKTLHNFVFLGITFLLLAGCAAPRMFNTVPADAAIVSDAMSFTAKPGMAKVYFVGGTQGFGAFTDPQIWGADFFIDGISVGQINQNEVLTLNVLPNSYTFTFQPANNTDANRVPSTRALSAGSVVIFRADLKMGGLALLFGPAASSSGAILTEITDRRLITSRAVVSSSACPASICGSTQQFSSTPSSSLNQARQPQSNTTSSLQKSEQKCKELGFTKGTEKYGDCVMRLAN